MPIYEYQCEVCGASFDKFVRSMSASLQIECPKCHSTDCKKKLSLFGTTSAGASAASSAACAPSG
ncbi:MAG: zinc ribbon domain-containing protein [Anaerolineae bacterium]|nr:zinc ribbon domain-containing protein [Anaerolineae bacterium]